MEVKAKGNALALLPLLVFITIFLGFGTYYSLQGLDYAFYQLPAPVAIIPAVIIALLLNKVFTSERTIDQAISSFIKGMGNNNVLTMCLIYLMAGAFSSVAQASGGVEAMVQLGLSFVPAPLVVTGLFVVSALVATAMGTSMGTIGAIAPIAVGIAGIINIDTAIIAGAIVGGAMFGDNLSFISDTTIASTKTQGAELKDKFKENFALALPAAIICALVYAYIGFNTPAQIDQLSDANWLLALPYIVIIALAVSGVNVFVVLLLGTLLSAISGVLLDTYQISSLGKDIYAGFTNMQEIFLLSMLIGGLSYLMKQQGGLTYLVTHLTQIVHNIGTSTHHKLNQVAIACLAFITNLAVANNTVAIIVTGETAKQLAEEGKITARRSASLLDIFSCIAQGIVPYGAQALLVAASFGLSPLEVVPQVWYCYVLAVVSIVAIKFRK